MMPLADESTMPANGAVSEALPLLPVCCSVALNGSPSQMIPLPLPMVMVSASRVAGASSNANSHAGPGTGEAVALWGD